MQYRYMGFHFSQLICKFIYLVRSNESILTNYTHMIITIFVSLSE